MEKIDLQIDPEKALAKITRFIKGIFKQQGFENVILAASGGIDSATSLFLLAGVLPPQNIFVVHLPHKATHPPLIKKMTHQLHIPKGNVYEIPIKGIVDVLEAALRINLGKRLILEKIRLGNIMARTRMIVLYDLAKKHKALVCGTENKSEYYLGYFTRFGDEASDFEPIRHLYKTQVYQLADYLGVSNEIINQKPTAGLWEHQTDEGEFGFTYKEADQILFLHFDKKLSLAEIEKLGFANGKKVLEWCHKNAYKHHTPFVLK